MVMVLQNSAQEVEQYIKDNPGPESKDAPKEEAKPEKANGTDDPKTAKVEDGDEEIPFAKQYGLTKEQSDAVTEVFRKEIGKKNLRRKDAEAFAASQYNEKRLAEERAERAERELAEIRKSAQPPVKEAAPPDRKDFATDQEYEDARVDWRADQRIKARDEEAAKARQKEREAEIMQTASERISKARELVPDFDEVVGAADDIIPSHIAAYMQESELFAELGYHFAQHPEDLKKLSAMPARTYSDLQRVGVALGKIESNIQPFAQAKVADASDKASTNGHAPSRDTGTVPSQARVPAPVIQPISVGSSTQVEKPESRMSYAEAKSKWERDHRKDLSRRSRH